MLQRDKFRYFYYYKNDINIEKDFGGIDMALTAVKSANAYKALCRVLERNEIIHECDEKNWCVKCSVSGNETDFQFAFVIEPSKMLIKLYVFLDIDLSQTSIPELSFALCVINDSLSDGHFCFDRSGTSLYFKITASFLQLLYRRIRIWIPPFSRCRKYRRILFKDKGHNRKNTGI